MMFFKRPKKTSLSN